MALSAPTLCKEILECAETDWWSGGEPQEVAEPELPGPIGSFEEVCGPVPVNLVKNLWQMGNGRKGMAKVTHPGEEESVTSSALA